MSKVAGAMSGLSHEEAEECRFFMEAIDGLSVGQVAQALMSIAPDSELKKSSKGAMARRWACRNSPAGDLPSGLSRKNLINAISAIKSQK